jgi:hypothetical protein
MLQMLVSRRRGDTRTSAQLKYRKAWLAVPRNSRLFEIMVNKQLNLAHVTSAHTSMPGAFPLLVISVFECTSPMPPTRQPESQASLLQALSPAILSEPLMAPAVAL